MPGPKFRSLVIDAARLGFPARDALRNAVRIVGDESDHKFEYSVTRFWNTHQFRWEVLSEASGWNVIANGIANSQTAAQLDAQAYIRKLMAKGR